MIVQVSSDAERDLEVGYWFYELQAEGVGKYFRDSLLADLQSLRIFGGVHEVHLGYYCMRAKRFPFAIYYQLSDGIVSVVAVLDARRDVGWVQNRLERG